jgi:archaellum component FlaF (FlaF/FlaG flagellin family)
MKRILFFINLIALSLLFTACANTYQNIDEAEKDNAILGENNKHGM